jgi:hypothetical protein
MTHRRCYFCRQTDQPCRLDEFTDGRRRFVCLACNERIANDAAQEQDEADEAERGERSPHPARPSR